MADFLNSRVEIKALMTKFVSDYGWFCENSRGNYERICDFPRGKRRVLALGVTN